MIRFDLHSILYSFKHLALLLGFVLLSETGALAQLIPHERYEREMKNSDNGFTIIPMKENGIVLVRERNKFNEGKRLWEVVLLDSALVERWTLDVEQKPNYNLIGYEFTPSHVYLLFREGDQESNEFNLAQVNLSDKSTNLSQIKHAFNFRLTHFTIVGENAVFGGYVSREPAVLLYESSSKSMKVIPGFFLKDTELLDLRMNHNNTFNALLVERNSLDKRHIVMKTFDERGLLLLEDYIEIDRERNILSGICSSLKREELIILGTYSESVSTESLGYFSVLVDPFSEQTVKYYPFTSLTHILDYMPSKRAARIKAKSDDRIAMGKNPDYKAYVQPVRIEETEEGFYLLSEMYDPASSTINNRTYRNDFYNPYYGYGYSPYSYNPFMGRYPYSPYAYNTTSRNTGVKMTESILALFDEKGNLTWDTSLEFNDIRHYAFEQSSDFVIRDNLIFLAYKKESDLFVNTSSLKDDPEMDTVKVPLKNESDVIRYESEEDSGIRYWYKNHFYAWGYQSVRDKSRKEEDPVRYVFYINRFETE